ncbi:hypothetical protein QCA50_006223 [Cerrena zonata]|uniref:Nucleoporin Nup159/Nup146 N-terminal domain-containing protein n=1 Tax=Cerrena zonata TaxID=2478898 RepID=A0AAW0GPF6_9APHY
MNQNQLSPPPPSSAQRVSKEAEDKETDFVTLRLLNRRARVRLSPEPLDLDSLPGKGELFAVANVLGGGCFAAVTRNTGGQHSLIVSPLEDLRTAFSSSTTEDSIPFTPKVNIPLSLTPNIITFAAQESRLIVGTVQGQILVYDSQQLASSPSPLHVFSSPIGTAPRQILSNPEGVPDLVAVLWEFNGAAGTPAIQILDVVKMQSVGGFTSGGSPETTPTTVSWSPKGKQIAVGLQSGDIVTYSPTDTSKIKMSVPRSSAATSQALHSTTWLSNPDFYAIHVVPGATADTEQTHVLLSLDAKSNTATEIKLTAPYLPFPGLRPPGVFTAVFRNWDPAKFLLFVGDSTSSDIGLIACLSDATSPNNESWCNFSLEETSRPAVPLDQELNETVLLGLSLDFTGKESFAHKTASGEDTTLPPPPVMYAYASDGTVIGWNVLNTKGTPYPGMAAAVTTTAGAISKTPSTDPMEASSEQPKPAAGFGAFAQSSTPSAFGQASFGQPSAFGKPSGFGEAAPSQAFGQTSFGQPSTLGSGSAFGGNTTSAFGQPSPFGATTTPSAFTSPNTGGGFSAFANAGPAKFGQSAFSSAPTTTSNTLQAPAMESSMSVQMSTSEEPMSAQSTSGPGLGGLSLGGSGPSDEELKSRPSIFGSMPSTNTNEPKSVFGSTTTNDSGSSSSFLKPASGFGVSAFSSPSSFGSGTSAFGSGTGAFGSGSSTTATSDTGKPSSAFGSTGFAAAKPATTAFGSTGFGGKPATSAFGQSSFGQSSFGKPAFGQSAFGQSGFGSTTPTPTPASTSTTSSSGGAFSAFASAGPSAFGAVAASANNSKPVWATSSEPEKKEETPRDPGNDIFGTIIPPTPSVFSAATPEKKPEPVIEPPAGVKTEPSSPQPLPAQTPSKPDVPSESTTPAATPAKPEPSTSNASIWGVPSTTPQTGLFANIQVHPTGFGKLESGHGAFGGGVVNKDSPFYSAPRLPNSVFGQPATTAPKSAFAPTSAFGPSSTPAGSSTSPAFGSTTPLGKTESVFGKSSWGAPATTTTPTTPEDKAETPRQVSVFSAFANVKSAFGTVAEGEKKSFKELLATDKDPPKPSASPKGKGRGSDDDDDDTQDFEEQFIVDGEHTYEDDASDFLSEDFSEGSYPDEGEEGEEEEHPSYVEEEAEPESSPIGSPAEAAIKIPLPKSPTPQPKERSPTPKSSTPSIQLTVPSPPQTPEVASRKSPTPSRDGSTTPPGSPSTSGRPSTRPTRSSPLASAPISGDDESSDEEETAKTPSKPPTDSSKEGVKRPKTPPLLSKMPAPPKPGGIFSMPLTGLGQPSGSGTTPPPIPALPIGGMFGNTQPTAAPSVFGSAPGQKSGSIFSAPLTTTTFGQPPATTTFGQPPATTAFGQTPITPPSPTTPPPPPSVFGKKPGTLTAPPSSIFTSTVPVFTPPAAPAGGLFGPRTTPGGNASPPKPIVPPSTPPAGGLFGRMSAAPVTPKPEELSVEEGMQAECAYLFVTLAKELDGLSQLAAEAIQEKELIYQPSMTMKSPADLGNSLRWTLGDVTEYGRVMKTVERRIEALKETRAIQRKAVRDLERTMLRASTRKEEIVRFSKASTDAEFARILKARTLSPEHLETQSQLRRQIRAIKDRIQKLEDTLQASKKRLNQIKSGKPAVRAPSLDTINRTYRNIDIAISQQSDDLTRLVSRMSKLKIKRSRDSPAPSSRFSASSEESRFLTATQDDKRAPVNVTSSIAVTTAAALNAERAAQRLKKALMKARKEPLLNTQAAEATTAYDFKTPPKADLARFLESATSSPAFSFSNTSPGDLLDTPQWDVPTFEVSGPDSPESPSPYSHASRVRKSTNKEQHTPSPKLKGTLGSTSTIPAGFSWGPLPAMPVAKGLVGSLPFSLTAQPPPKVEPQ